MKSDYDRYKEQYLRYYRKQESIKNQTHRKIIFTILLLGIIIILSSIVIIKFINLPQSDKTFSGEIDVTRNPVQIMKSMSSFKHTFRGKEVEIFPLATYNISMVVTHKQNFRFSDSTFVTISPIDLCGVWGPLSYPDRLKNIKSKHMNRVCNTRIKGDYPSNWIEYKSNIHTVPSNENIFRALNILKKGKKVRLEGYLVNFDSGTRMHMTSLSRSDDLVDYSEESKRGDCEIMYVKKVIIGNKIYT